MEPQVYSMDSNITQVEDYIMRFLDKDNLIDQWLLTKTPYPTLIVLFVYFSFVLKIGPQFMENRRPFKLKTAMRVYNLCQVLGNIRLIYYPLIKHARNLPYIIQASCIIPKETDENIDELTLMLLYLIHGYLVLKWLDLLDTVFMVLRKKDSNITFLHVYHHATMVFGSWFSFKYLSVQGVIPGMINTIVHTVMYSYFFLSTFGEPIKKYLWWKKHLTKLQLAQFVFILIYIFALYYNGCPVSKVFTFYWLFNVFVIFCLFVNFYVRSYVMKPSPVKHKTNIKND